MIRIKNVLQNQTIDYLLVFFTSMLPVVELRGAIPLGAAFQLNPWLVLIISILGNIVPAVFLLFLLDPVVKFLFSHSPFLTRHLKKHFEKLHAKHSLKFNELGAIFLVAFVAIPLPGTGAWTGVLLAYLFNIPFKIAFVSILLGVIGAGIIIAFFTESVISIFS